MYGSSRRAFQDPAAEAAALILRLGIAILAIGAPCAAVVSRRLLFVLMPVGAALIVIGGLLTPGGRSRLEQLKPLATSPIVLLTFFIVFWSGLSLLWTPFAGLAVERFLKSAGTVLVAAVAVAALPASVRASNSNLLPIGVAAAALAIVCVAVLSPAALRASDPDGSTLQRAAIGVVVLAWPALGALALRQRVAAAGVVAAGVAVTAIVVWMPSALSALIIAMLIFSIAFTNPLATGRALAVFSAVLMLAAPAIPFLAQAIIPRSFDQQSVLAVFPVWAQIVKTDGLRLVTGHGFDTAARAAAIGFLPANTPRGILFEVWFELGLLGAASVAALMALLFVAAGRAERTIAPFLLSALACAGTIAVAGLSFAQLWWVTLLATTAICFAIVQRGDHRVQRVRAKAVTRRRSVL